MHFTYPRTPNCRQGSGQPLAPGFARDARRALVILRTRMWRWQVVQNDDGSRNAMDLLEVVRGCTFDDFLLTPRFGVVPSRDPAVIDLTTRFTTGITIRRPIVAANMDTITRADMSAVLAEEGGI